MPDTPTFGRYAEIPYEQMTPEQQEGYRSMMESRGGLPGPSKIWVHNPKLAKVAGPFGAHFHPGHYSLTDREREIAVCVITSKCHSAYPTNAHERRGKEVGLPADKVEAMHRRPADVVRRRARAGRLRDGDGARQCALGPAWPLRPRGQGTRPCRHHRRDHLDGPLQQRRDDPGVLRRAGRGDRHGALSQLAVRRAMLTSISAITLATHDMARAVAFYQALGFVRKFGGPAASFTSFLAGSGYLNLMSMPAERVWTWWGRAIFYVDDVDAQLRSLYRPASHRPSHRGRIMGRALLPHRRSGRTRTQLRAADLTDCTP